MGELPYRLLWLVLTLFPAITAWKRQWLSFALYTAGWLLFLYTVQDRKDGWDDLANIATLTLIVIPVYLAATLLWALGFGKGRRRKR